jgi:hypothetical protein
LTSAAPTRIAGATAAASAKPSRRALAMNVIAGLPLTTSVTREYIEKRRYGRENVIKGRRPDLEAQQSSRKFA